MSGLHTVHVRINDAATGKPTPVRIRFVGAGQTYYAPFGRLTDLPVRPNEDDGGNLRFLAREKGVGFEQWAYIDGSCEINLPADPVRVEIRKGPEYRSVRQTITLGPGKMALRLAIERWIDLRQERWYSGDVAAHFLAPHAALLEGMAEDLAVVNLLALEWRDVHDKDAPWTIPNILEFSGQHPSVQAPGHLVVVNTLNSGGRLGALALLNCHRVVFPLSTGCGLSPAYHWTLADWCDQCHRKGGLTVWTWFGSSWNGDAAQRCTDEVLADLILGKIDAIQVDWLDGPRNYLTDEWYRLLSCNLRVPLVAGSGKLSNSTALGHVRTYARLNPGEEFTYKNWIEGVRAGRTFVTNGPLLTFTVNGQDPGAVISLPADSGRVAVRAEARSRIPFERLELVHNGSVLAGIEASGDPCSALLEGNVELPGSGWLAARCWGSHEVRDADVITKVAAHTSPVYIEVAGQPMRADDIALALLVDRIDKMLAWVEAGARFENERQKEKLLGIFQAARTRLVQRG